MVRIKDFLRRASGLKPDTLRRIDMIEELRPGRLVFADVGRHQPVQEYLYRMAWLDPMISQQPTVELKFSSCTDTLAHYGRQRSEGKLDHLPVDQVSIVRRDGNLKHVHGGGYDRDMASEVIPFEDRFRTAITTCTKTIVDLYYAWGWDDGEAERLRPFNEIATVDYAVRALRTSAREIRAGNAKASIYVIEMLSDECDTEEFTRALLELRDAGAAVLYVRRVSSPSPTYDLPADLHLIERYPLKNEFDDEVVLITGERVVVDVPVWGSRRPRWYRVVPRTKPMPTIAEYNSRPDDHRR